MPNTFIIVPKWRNFAKSGHTAHDGISLFLWKVYVTPLTLPCAYQIIVVCFLPCLCVYVFERAGNVWKRERMRERDGVSVRKRDIERESVLVLGQRKTEWSLLPEFYFYFSNFFFCEIVTFEFIDFSKFFQIIIESKLFNRF